MSRKSTPAEFVHLYRQAFLEYETHALRNKRPLDDPTPEDALMVARAWRNGSSRPAVPLSKIQGDVLRLPAAHRDPERYIAGSTESESSRYRCVVTGLSSTNVCAAANV
ncbi:MAG TPA: hypothetical protein VG297_10980 [Bryobacteraceae bacterium]|jgi:hypothetical protein|nr:hypothetical protein [Bryobacteraceae bacterium]